jgi:hypothetical protein
MGVSNEAKNVIPLKFLRKIKNKKYIMCLGVLLVLQHIWFYKMPLKLAS